MTRLLFVILFLFAVFPPRPANAEYWCQKEDRRVIGVAPDGSILFFSQTPSGGADCGTDIVQVFDKSGSGKPVLEISSGAQWDCDRVKVTRGKMALSKAEQKLGVEKLADKLAKSLGATPLSPSKRSDLFTAHASADFDERVAETNTTIYLRWDGEPVLSKTIGNYAMGVGKLQLFEHPSSPGFFVEFTSVDHNEEKTSECGLVHYTFYVSPADIAAHAQLVEARAAAVKTPEVAAAILRERVRAGNKDPLLTGRLARTEIAAGKKKGKKTDSCQIRTRRPLGMTETGGLVFSARVKLQPSPGKPCTEEERVVVEDSAGKTLLRVERRLPNQCDPVARGWTVYEGAAALPQDKVAAAADLEAVTAIVAARYSYTALSHVAGSAVPRIEYGRDGIRFFDDDKLLLRQKWRTTSPSAAITVARLGHGKSRNHVLRYVSAPGWRWSESSVCEDEIEDFALLTAARMAEIAAVASINDAENMSAAMTALQKQLDVKAARDAFLERATKQSVCGEKLLPLYKAVKSRKSSDLRSFAADLCTRNRDDGCHDIDEPCGQATD